MSTPAIVLIGPMGSGKSSVGRRVAKALALPFFDSDAAVVRAHGPISDIFASSGEEVFRAFEREAVTEGLRGGGIVALGGGAVLHPDTQTDLAEHRVVLLTVSPHRIASRLGGSTRPLLDADDPIARWKEVYASRRELYEHLADVTFDTSHGPLMDVVDAITNWAGTTDV